MQEIFGSNGHYELSKSSKAEEYVWKEETSVIGTRFEFGCKPINRNNATEWDRIWELAVAGRILEIDTSIRISHYRTLRSIAADYAQPVPIERTAVVYWGKTGVGKSRRAWEEAGMSAYPKDPRSKFWCGYNGQEHVIVDEFRGGIDISHFLRWVDRYPCIVEIKGSSVVLLARRLWFTSNLHPRDWYPMVDAETLMAVMRRLEIVEIT